MFYSPTGGRVKIVETVSGSVTSTKQFIGGEERDGSGNITKQFFSRGQRNGSTNFFYAKDHVGSIRTLSDDSGAVQASFSFDPFGKTTKLEGSADSDFGFAGMFVHARSGLNVTPGRLYSATLGRWLNRDPIKEAGGINLYSYARNAPNHFIDPLGLTSYPLGVPTITPSESFWLPTGYYGELGSRHISQVHGADLVSHFLFFHKSHFTPDAIEHLREYLRIALDKPDSDKTSFRCENGRITKYRTIKSDVTLEEDGIEKPIGYLPDGTPTYTLEISIFVEPDGTQTIITAFPSTPD